MKRILLILTICLPLLTVAQVQQPPTTGGYNVSSSQVTLYRNGTGIDANLRIFGGSTYGYFDVPTLRKVASRTFVSDTTNRYINLNSGDDLSFNSAQWRDKNQVNYYSTYNPAFPLVSADPAKPFGYFWMGTVLVDKSTNTGIMRATQ